jgi:hypothetical protein
MHAFHYSIPGNTVNWLKAVDICFIVRLPSKVDLFKVQEDLEIDLSAAEELQGIQSSWESNSPL